MPSKTKIAKTAVTIAPNSPKKIATRVSPVEVDRMRRSAYDVVRRSMPDVRGVLRGDKTWSNQQVRLFSILLNKVLPDLHHSYMEHSHEINNLSALSIAELERIASGQDTRVINATATATASPSPGSSRSSTPTSSSTHDDAQDPSDIEAFEATPSDDPQLEAETYIDVGAVTNVRARAKQYINSIRYRARDAKRANTPAELEAIEQLRNYKSQLPTVTDLDKIMEALRDADTH